MTQALQRRRSALRSRLNALLKGKIGQFSLDALVNIASRAAERTAGGEEGGLRI